MTARPPRAADDPALPALPTREESLDWATTGALGQVCRAILAAHPEWRTDEPAPAPATIAAGAPDEAGRDASVDQHSAVLAARRN